MGKFSESLEKAANNAERLASAMQSIPSLGSDSGSVGGVGGGNFTTNSPGGLPGVVTTSSPVFNTTVNVEGSGGSGSGGSGSGRTIGLDPFVAYLHKLGLSNTKGMSKQMLDHLMREFERMLKKNSDLGLTLRASGS